MIDVSAKIEQARLHVEAGRAEQARALLDRALRQSPGHPDLCNAMSMVLQSMGRADTALYFAQRAAQGRPTDSGFQQNLGNVYAGLGRGPESESAYRKAIEINPAATGARLGLSHVLRLTYRYAESTDQLREAIKTTPGDVELFSALSPLLLKQARVEESVEAARHGLSLQPGHSGCAIALAHAMNYMPGVGGADVLAAHKAAGLAHSPETRFSAHPNSRDPNRTLRIGLLSGDFRRHAVMFFLEPFLEHHDRSSLELICYSTGQAEDEVTARVKARVALWRPLAGATPRAIAETIHKDHVDILIELAGLMAGHNLPAVALKPAPIQVTYLGYPATTGFPEIDYRVVDSLTDPPGSEAFASEKLVRIDPSFLCYRPPEERPDTARAPGGGLTFGSFNAAAKINRQVFRVWARMLKETPTSRLLLKSLEYYDPAMASFIRSRFAAEGIDPARIECSQVKRTFEEHLSSYRDVDIALDPFPYNGTTTTFEALSMSVPVVTLQGQRHVERVSAAILTNLGLTDLIASDENQYISIATSLAADPARLATLRESIRPRLLNSTLCDGPAYAARMDRALRGMWQEWCARPR